MIKNFTIYGERCSGTNFLEAMQENGWYMYLNPSSRFFSVFNK